MRAWDSRTSVHSQTQTSVGVSTGTIDDPAFAHQESTLRSVERSIVSDFGEDPVVFARSHGSSTQDGGGNGLWGIDEAKDVSVVEVPNEGDVVELGPADVHEIEEGGLPVLAASDVLSKA